MTNSLYSRRPLENSWIDADERGSDGTGGSPAPSEQNIMSLPLRRQDPEGSSNYRRKRRQRSSRDAHKTDEPELIMPPLYTEDAWSKSNSSPTASWQRQAIDINKKNDNSTSSSRLPSRSSTQQSKTTPLEIESTRLGDRLVEYSTDSFCWVIDVLGGTLRYLKTPISYALALYIFLGLLVLLANFLTNSFYAALSPLCRIPGASLIHIPFCQLPSKASLNGETPSAEEFDLLMGVQDKMGDVLGATAEEVALPWAMKRGEASIRDLRQVVRFSQLRSKNELLLEFDGFIETARMASYDLQRFNSHVGRTVDNMLAIARWTNRVLDNIAAEEASRGFLARLITDKILAPFQPVKFNEDALLNQYIQHSHAVEGEIKRLVSEAQDLLYILQNLEDRLDVISGIAMRDKVITETSKDEVLTQLLTKLGGNRAELKKFNSQLYLLKQVAAYGRTAWKHVTDTLIKLQGMSAELEELRERVGSTEMLKDREDIPLSAHIEAIQMGIERLEGSKEAAKEVEKTKLIERNGQEIRAIDDV